jgi:hypothetical protein
VDIEEQEACFTVRDQSDQALAYVYFEKELGRRAAAKLLTRERGPAHRRQRRGTRSSRRLGERSE